MNMAKILLTSGLIALLTLAACVRQPTAKAPPMPESMKYAAKPMGKLENSSAVFTEQGPRALINGKSTTSALAVDVNSGVVVPDGKGGVIIIPSDPKVSQNPNYLNAREFKLKIRELAEQLIAGINDKSFLNAVALPVSFVNVDDLEQTSSFGRLITEQLFYEFNQRGFAVKEYRATGTIKMEDGAGEFYLNREVGELATKSQNTVVVAGTYYSDKQSIIVNARLIRPSDGRILRSANLVFQSSPTTRRMLSSKGKKLGASTLHIRDVKETHPKESTNPIDKGADIH